MILDKRINWMIDWDNDPEFQILVDKDFLSNYSTTKINHTCKNGMLYGEKDGIVSYYYTHNGKGFAGRSIDFLIDNQIQTINGPFYGEPANAMTFSYTADLEAYNRGYTFYFGFSITLELAKEWAKELNAFVVYNYNRYTLSLKPDEYVKPRKYNENILIKNYTTNSLEDLNFVWGMV